jgi:hypothetical protein
MEIDNELSNLDKNFDKTITSVKKSIEYWERYYLTLPGRINVIKSLLFPLVLYLGCFIMPTAEKVKKIQNLLDNFAVGNLNFSKKRITLPQEKGGLGLFDVNNFLTGQQPGWIFKAHKSSRDNWRAKLRAMSFGNVLCTGPKLFPKKHNPILHGLASSYEIFRLSHDRLHSNCIRAFIINNQIFVREQGNRELLDFNYLEMDERVANKLSSMTAMNFFNVNGLKTRMEVVLEFRFNLSINAYAKIATSLNYFVRRMRPNNRNNGSVRSVTDEFLSLKNPGKKTRLWITKNSRDKFDISKTNPLLHSGT